MDINVTFRFPSNGKAFLNLAITVNTVAWSELTVSIPFKREGVSERDLCISKAYIDVERFDSLQTGRRF